jgi:hypothetical protein
MQEEVFRDYLISRNFSEETIVAQVSFIDRLEKHLQKIVPIWTLDDIHGACAQTIVDDLIDRGENSLENLKAIARYAWSVRNDSLYAAIFRMLDGYEAMDQLYKKLAAFAGEDLRDIIFEDMPLPPLGLSQQEKSRYTYRLINRMETIFEESTTREILKDCLRILPDTLYEADKRMFAACKGDIDQFLQQKGRRFIENLEGHRNRGELFFGQEIDDAVIDFVKSNPQIGQGQRKGRVIMETKIPYNTKAYLAEMDPDKKRYQYCHCPWARESLRNRYFTVSSTFCQCSAGFHKKRYEVIFAQPLQAEVLQSVLNGDPVCQFAINLPESLQLI